MTSEIKSRIIGNLGHITLNRPKALNALTYVMCEEITRLLVSWEKDPKAVSYTHLTLPTIYSV